MLASFAGVLLSVGSTARAQVVNVPSPPSGDQGQVYQVKEGDTLWNITEWHLGDPQQWPRVWSWNPQITSPHWIYPGNHIRLEGDGAPPNPSVRITNQAKRSSSRRLRRRPQPHRQVLAAAALLDRGVLQQSGRIVGSATDWMMLGPGAPVTLRFSGKRYPPGAMMAVFVEEELDDRMPEQMGTLVRVVGLLRIAQHDPDTGLTRGRIQSSSDVIERGYRVTPATEPFFLPRAIEAPKRRGKVIATLDPQGLSSAQQVVFVNLGKAHGVTRGAALHVFRRDDPFEGHEMRNQLTVVPGPYHDGRIPRWNVARGLVVGVQPGSSAVWLTSAHREVRVGDHVSTRR